MDLWNEKLKYLSIKPIRPKEVVYNNVIDTRKYVTIAAMSYAMINDPITSNVTN